MSLYGQSFILILHMFIENVGILWEVVFTFSLFVPLRDANVV